MIIFTADKIKCNMETKKCKYFLENAELFWFIPEYFGEETLSQMCEYALRRDYHSLKCIAEDIWFKLPDNIFNIKENPSGWTEFISFLDD